MPTCKMMLFGAGGVGKSSLVLQLVNNQFIEDYDPTIEDLYKKQVQVDQEACMLEILDTAGREDSAVLLEQYIKSCEGFLCVYDITNRGSFEEIKTGREKIRQTKEGVVPMLFAGSKCDLDSQRQVPQSEGKDYAAQHGCPFFETSAKQRLNVEEAFLELARQMRMSSKKKPAGKRHGCSLL